MKTIFDIKTNEIRFAIRRIEKIVEFYNEELGEYDFTVSVRVLEHSENRVFLTSDNNNKGIYYQLFSQKYPDYGFEEMKELFFTLTEYFNFVRDKEARGNIVVKFSDERRSDDLLSSED